MNATNATSVPNSILVLGYGCDYQGGFIFALDDTQGCAGSDCTGSIGGKVIAPSDQIRPPSFGGIIWSSNGGIGTVSSNVSYDLLPGIDETSTSLLGSPTYTDFTTFLVVPILIQIPLPPPLFPFAMEYRMVTVTQVTL